MSRLSRDRILDAGLGITALVTGSIVLAIVAFLLREAWPTISSGQLVRLFTDENWQPGSVREPEFGITPMLVGSVLVTALAIAIALPLGIGSAFFQVFYAPKFVAKWQTRFVELLAGVPSVIFGFWGLTVIVPLINQIQAPGQSLLAAGLVLSLMILPTVALTAQSAFRSLDPGLLEGASALGLSRPTTLFSLVLPATKGGLFSGAILAITRAIGETLAVVMVCGNIAKIPHSVFDPVRPITATIALEMGYATAEHKSLLYATGLILVILTGALMAWPLFQQLRSDDRRADT